MPRQALDPLPKPTKERSSFGLAIQRLGTKRFESGKRASSWQTSTVVIETGVFLGIVQAPYLVSALVWSPLIGLSRK